MRPIRRLRGFRAMVMGPPGSGKGTLAAKIVKMYRCKHISTGTILRQHVERKTDLGIKAEVYMKSGTLVPDELLTEIVYRSISKVGNENFLLDGYPRNLAQAKDLDKRTSLDFVINIDLAYCAIVRRIQHRLVHIESGRTYNLMGENSPRTPGRDDITNEPLVRRADDKPEIFWKRLERYDELMMPVLRYYMKQNIIENFHIRRHENLWPYVERYLKAKWRVLPRRRVFCGKTLDPPHSPL